MKNIYCCFWGKQKQTTKNPTKLSSFPLTVFFTQVTIFVVKNSKHMLVYLLKRKKKLSPEE